MLVELIRVEIAENTFLNGIIHSKLISITTQALSTVTSLIFPPSTTFICPTKMILAQLSQRFYVNLSIKKAFFGNWKKEQRRQNSVQNVRVLSSVYGPPVCRFFLWSVYRSVRRLCEAFKHFQKPSKKVFSECL